MPSKFKVGQIVLYRLRESQVPAIITLIAEEGYGLVVFDPFGGTYGIMQVEAGDGPGQFVAQP